MSRWTTKADRIREHLLTLDVLRGVQVIVHRENDLMATVNQRLSKNTGCAVLVITWTGGTNPDRRSKHLRIGARYSLALWMSRVAADKSPADDVIEEIAEHIHGWVDPEPGAMINRLEVTSIELIPEAPQFLVYEILAEISRV